MRLALAVMLAFALGVLPYHLLDGGGIRRIPELERELAATRAAIEALRVDNQRYREQIAALKNDPEAIEDIARDELGMVKPSELVFRVDSPASGERP